jgi:hypothetical protein
LEKLNLPNVTEISKNAFSQCTSLCDVEFPKVITIRGFGFHFCKNLGKINVPLL